MEPTEKEYALLAEAVNALHEETGLRLDVVQEQVNLDGQQVGAIIKMPAPGGELAAEVKRWAQQANLGALAAQVKRLPGEGVLVADYINPNMAKKLMAMGVQYFDTAGNAYINQPPVYIRVTGNKQPQREVKAIAQKQINRAFDAAGLKVVFGFLCDPLLVTATYREIAERTDVALGTVGKVLNDLTDAGFIIDRGRGKGRRLVNRVKMLDRWVEAYPEKLKPKLHAGEFMADQPYWWQEVDIEKYGAYWGGELAAAKYTDYLKPQTITIYLPADAGTELLAKAKLRKAVDGTIDGPGRVSIYRPFWPDAPKPRLQHKSITNGVEAGAGLVNPILAYADLIATGDSRNLETARIIYERYIAEHIGQD